MGVIVVLLLAIIVILLGGGTLVLWSAAGLGAALLLAVIIAVPVVVIFKVVQFVDLYSTSQGRTAVQQQWRRVTRLLWIMGAAVTLSLTLPQIVLDPRRALAYLAVGIVGWLTLWYGGSLIIDWYHARRHHTST
jgi:archaellum biogenesis protein FlaJ (TadC family)